MTKEEAINYVKDDGMKLHQLSDEFKSDKDIVLEAVFNWGVSLQYASDELKIDRQVVLMAINSDAQAYQYCGEVMQRDPDVIKLVNKNLMDLGISVDDFLCDGLIELKEKYGVGTLKLALELDLEVEAANEEVDRLSVGGDFSKKRRL